MTSDGRGQASLITSSGTIALNPILIFEDPWIRGGIRYWRAVAQAFLICRLLERSEAISPGPTSCLSLGEYLKNANLLVIGGELSSWTPPEISPAGIPDGGWKPSVSRSRLNVAQPLTGSLLVGSGNFPGKARLPPFNAFLPLAFDVYPINATHLILIGTGRSFHRRRFQPGNSLAFRLAGFHFDRRRC